MRNSPVKYDPEYEPENNLVMNSTLNFRIILLSISMLSYTCLTAQPGMNVYADAGKSCVSDGLFIKSAAIGSYEFGKSKVEAGVQANLKCNGHPMFSGYCVSASREQVINASVLSARGFFTWASSNGVLRETNWGVLFSMKHKRFEMSVGTNFRTYAFKAGAVQEYKIGEEACMFHENFNLMYSIGCNVMPTDDRWNVGLSVTNYDYFTINQEVNPALRLRGLYKPGSQVCLYAEVWHQNAGLLNMSINHYGLLFKTGVSWNF
jgi:hypothetical protein